MMLVKRLLNFIPNHLITERNNMNIKINGESHTFSNETISYDDVSILAYGKVLPGLSMVYKGPRNGDSCRAGSLWTGKSVIVEDGMRFEAMFTGNA